MTFNTKDINRYLLKIQQGDKSYVEPLYKATANHLLIVAKFYLFNKSLAEDVVSTTFINVLSYIHSFNPKQSGYNWMCKIVQNAAQTINNSEKRIYLAQGKAVANQPTEYYDKNFDYDLDFDDTLRLIKDKTDKMIVFRRYYLDEKYEQIAVFLDISRAAVCKRVKKIIKFLKKFKKK